MSLALLFLYLMLNILRMLIHPSSGACDLCAELFRGLYWSGSMYIGVTLWYGCGSVTSTPTHIGPDQCNPWNNSAHKSQAPEDGYINIRNMLSIKQRNNKASDTKLISLYSTIKMMHAPINIKNYKIFSSKKFLDICALQVTLYFP